MKSNQDLRKRIEDEKVRYWEVADKYGVTDGNFSKMLRKELPDEVKNKLNKIIDELAEEKRM